MFWVLIRSMLPYDLGTDKKHVAMCSGYSLEASYHMFKVPIRSMLQLCSRFSLEASYCMFWLLIRSMLPYVLGTHLKHVTICSGYSEACYHLFRVLIRSMFPYILGTQMYITICSSYVLGTS